MSKTLVIYKTRYGSTGKYAQWITRGAGADICELSALKPDSLGNYNTIVYCGGLYAGGIAGFSSVKKHLLKLSGKKIIVVAVGSSVPDKDTIKAVKSRNFTPEMDGKFMLFQLRGGMDYPRMGIMHRMMMATLVRVLKSKKPEELEANARGIIETYGKVTDFTSEDSIKPIVDEILK